MLALILALLAASCAPQPPAPTLPPTGSGPAAAGPGKGPESSSSAPSRPAELTIFAAASLTAAFEEIGELYEREHPGVIVVFNFAGSQALAQQIIEGAPADGFASANQTQMEVVVEAGEVVTGTQQVFARNRLVVIYPQDNPAGLKGLKDLAEPGLKLVFAAQEVPVGQYSLEFLEKASADPAFGPAYQEGVLANVVSYEDNVKAVLAKVALGEADAGIVYTSDISEEEAGKVGRLDIPAALNVIAAYPIAPVQRSENPELAQAFIDLVLSPEGQAILTKYNFIPAEKAVD
jgi:molybdate transport system substrate-binding protein